MLDPERKDLNAATGIINGVLAGTIMIILVFVAVWFIVSVVQAEEHEPHEPPCQDHYYATHYSGLCEKDWLTPCVPNGER